jgi:hypothetical protein
MDSVPPSDFSTFVLTLSTSAMLYLGEIPDPDGKKVEVNLPMARHSIDLLIMLRDKTRGNLTKEEQDLLDRMVYDLRMKFVAKTEK